MLMPKTPQLYAINDKSMTTNSSSTQCLLFGNLSHSLPFILLLRTYLKVSERFDLWMMWGSDDKKKCSMHTNRLKWFHSTPNISNDLRCCLKKDSISKISITIIILHLEWTGMAVLISCFNSFRFVSAVCCLETPFSCIFNVDFFFASARSIRIMH